MSDIFRDEAIKNITELSPKHFYGEENRAIFSAILLLIKEGAKPEPLLVYELVKKYGVSASYVSGLQEYSCIPSQIGHYVDILHKTAHGRAIRAMIENAAISFVRGDDYADIEAYISNALLKYRAKTEVTESLDACNFDELFSGDEKDAGVMFGIDELDAAVGGIRPGEVCIVAARTSVGKSAFAVMAAVTAAEYGIPVLYMSYEMPLEQIYKRALAYWAGISLRKFREKSFDDFELSRIQEADKEMQDIFKLIRVNTEANTPSELLKTVRVEKMCNRAGFVIIDHAGRMRSDSRARSDYERMSEIANALKDIAISVDVPMLVLWQLNRGVEKTQDKKPTMADLRDSGQAEEVADSIILLYRDNYYSKDIPMQLATVTATVAKVRDGGQLGDVQFPWLRILKREEKLDDDPPF